MSLFVQCVCVVCWWRRVSFFLSCLIVKEWSGNLFNVTESPYRKVWSFRITLSPSGLNGFFHDTSTIVMFRVKSHQIRPMIFPNANVSHQAINRINDFFVRELLNSYIAMKIPFQRGRFPQKPPYSSRFSNIGSFSQVICPFFTSRPATGEILRCSWRMPSIPRAQLTRWRFKLLDEQPRRRLNMKRRSGNYARRIGSLDCGDVQLCSEIPQISKPFECFFSRERFSKVYTLFQAVAEVFENLLRDRNW